MRMRAMDANGDMTFGMGSANFFVNSPETVAQLVQTRLGLWLGEWYLDTADGTPYLTQVLGSGTGSTYDLAIQARILSTQSVRGIAAYQSYKDPNTRALTITATIDTLYGTTTLTATA